MNTTPYQDAVQSLLVTTSPEEENAEAVNVEAQDVQDDVELDLSDDNEAIETDDSPAIEAPNSWSNDDKEHFSSLPREAQTRIANRERDRDLNIRKSQDEIAAERKDIEAERETVKEARAKYLENLIGRNKKPSTDMLDPESDTYDPDAYHLENAKYEKGLSEAQEIEAEVSLESAKDLSEWQNKEIKHYQEILPEFVDVKNGPAFRQELAEYAVQNLGITMEEAARRFPITAAAEMSIMNKARLYDRAIAKRNSSKKNPTPKSLKAGNSNPGKPETTDKTKLAASFAKTGSRDDALSLLMQK